MFGDFVNIQRPLGELQFTGTLSSFSMLKTNTHKILTNLILKGPPESLSTQDFRNKESKEAQSTDSKNEEAESGSRAVKEDESDSQNWPEGALLGAYGEETRVKGKLHKKGKRDGENIRTYARYDSVIQALEEELHANKIIPTTQDQKVLEHFDMKSKRSLERFFFYLLLAKRQGKLEILLPQLKTKILAKVQEKGGHRTSQFLTCLRHCISKYLKAAEKLSEATCLIEAKKAFSIAYFDGEKENESEKRPHHNKIKGVEKCVGIFEIIMRDMLAKNQTQSLNQSRYDQNSQQDQNKMKPILQYKCEIEKINEDNGNGKKVSWCKDDDESFNIDEEEDLIDNHAQRRRKVGVKSKKQDERDIQKYAKFDIVSESCLEFLKKQKLHRTIPDLSKKVSHRSLHFFFAVLALVQKQKKDAEFLSHLESNYQKKVQKRYTQRSEYFRERLYESFDNLIGATRKLLEGYLDEALDIAYEVKAEKKPHPAKACQQKKCKEIYLSIHLNSSIQAPFNEQQKNLMGRAWIRRQDEEAAEEVQEVQSPQFSYDAMEQQLQMPDRFEFIKPCISGRSGSIQTSSGLWAYEQQGGRTL